MLATIDAAVGKWLFCGSAQNGARPTPYQVYVAVLHF